MTQTRKCLSNESDHHDRRFRNTLDLMNFMTVFDDSCQGNQIVPVISRKWKPHKSLSPTSFIHPFQPPDCHSSVEQIKLKLIISHVN